MGGLSFSTSDYSNFGQNKCTGQAIYDYDTGVDGDLKFKSGDLITITKRVNQDWLQGELSGRRGIFPFNYITTVSGDLTQLPATDQDQIPTEKPKSINERNQLLLGNLPTVTATFDYFSGVEGDLQFKAGDVIEVVNENQGNGWIMGKLGSKTGLVPLTYTNRPT
uniref:SH3 domain-containing protein n=1 Tax=Ditylenchus dipsaci TaxID=166011 RepID=A0A915CPL6_9BILA